MTTAPTPTPSPAPTRPARWLLVPLAGFAVVSLLAGFLADADVGKGGGAFARVVRAPATPST